MEKYNSMSKRNIKWPISSEDHYKWTQKLALLDRNLWNFLTATNEQFYRMTVTLNNHHLVIKMLTKPFTACTNILRKDIDFYDAYNTTFQDFLFSTRCMTHSADYRSDGTGWIFQGNNIQFTQIITKLLTTFHTNIHYSA